MSENKSDIIAAAKEKIEMDGWVFFKYPLDDWRNAGLFKARTDGSDLTCVATIPKKAWDELCIIKAEDGWIHFEVIESYSEHEDSPYVFEHYRDEVTYKVKADGKELTEIKRLRRHTGTSD